MGSQTQAMKRGIGCLFLFLCLLEGLNCYKGSQETGANWTVVACGKSDTHCYREFERESVVGKGCGYWKYFKDYKPELQLCMKIQRKNLCICGLNECNISDLARTIFSPDRD